MLVLNDFTHDARVHREAKSLSAAGYSVLVIALWKKGLANHEFRDGYEVIRIPLQSRNWRGKIVAPIIKYFEFSFRFWKLTRKSPADIYHSHDANTLPAGWLAVRQNRSYFIYDAHELETGRYFGASNLSPIYQRFWALPERVFIHKANAVITVNNSIARELVKLYKVQYPTVLMNCPEKRKSRKTNLLRETLNIPKNKKIVLYQGRIASGRGIEKLIESTQQIPNVVSVVLGDGPLLTKFRSEVMEGNIKNVYLPGRIPLVALPSFTSSADLGAVLTEDTCQNHHLSLPNKIFEYIQAGIPVVSSDLPEIARIINADQIGQLVNPENIDSIKHGIEKILENEKEYSKMRANVRKAAQTYNWENESQKLLDLYAQF